MQAILLWSACSLIILIYGIFAFFSKKAYGFWANGKDPVEVIDVKSYNHALGRLFIVYAVLLELLGIPLLTPERKLLIALVTGLGTGIVTIAMVTWYVIKIEQKYAKK